MSLPLMNPTITRALVRNGTAISFAAIAKQLDDAGHGKELYVTYMGDSEPVHLNGIHALEHYVTRAAGALGIEPINEGRDVILAMYVDAIRAKTLLLIGDPHARPAR